MCHVLCPKNDRLQHENLHNITLFTLYVHHALHEKVRTLSACTSMVLTFSTSHVKVRVREASNADTREIAPPIPPTHPTFA